MNIENNKILVYTPIITSRLNYIFHFILEDILGIEIIITDDQNHFKQSLFPKFTYSSDIIISGQSLLIGHQILFETDIKKIDLELVRYQKHVIFFRSSKESFFPFDIFAASFFLITRYEEYLPFSSDKHKRFPAEASLASKGNFLEEPIVDIWCNLFKLKLLELYPQLVFKERKFRFLSTIDIDNAFAHLHKGYLRTFFSVMQLLLTDPMKLTEKIKVLKKEMPDPYDNYESLDEIHKLYGVEVIYFILFSKYGKYDKNIRQSNSSFQSLIKKIYSIYHLGIHPSYCSNNNYNLFKSEKEKLELVIKSKITKSRQHFLKLSFPETFEKLISLGIQEDYSMGYAEKPGFRASTCTPFYFFNLKSNELSSLKLIPFSVMDVCFKDYLLSSPASALIKIKKIISSIQKVDGLFVSLWHNESLKPANNQLSWRDVYEGMLDTTKNGS